jgi:hypothetical protein
MSFTLDPDDEEISFFKSSCLNQCIIGGSSTQAPLPAGIPPIFSNPTNAILLQLANGISCQNNKAQAMNDLLTC